MAGLHAIGFTSEAASSPCWYWRTVSAAGSACRGWCPLRRPNHFVDEQA